MTAISTLTGRCMERRPSKLRANCCGEPAGDQASIPLATPTAQRPDDRCDYRDALAARSMTSPASRAEIPAM
ncbi:hypothetical protein AWC14_01145 [Mycobacterium kyorinense]|uniref:Uncharacterized protein n=1 Tax=Mycobacterium kyorinense TaxID=487514 RepID=A0A1X1YMD6_9MYCO|nr:hypothetical protein AWC14_01145 [Mycobacterium kyorinense]